MLIFLSFFYLSSRPGVWWLLVYTGVFDDPRIWIRGTYPTRLTLHDADDDGRTLNGIEIGTWEKGDAVVLPARGLDIHSQVYSWLQLMGGCVGEACHGRGVRHHNQDGDDDVEVAVRTVPRRFAWNQGCWIRHLFRPDGGAGFCTYIHDGQGGRHDI